MGMGMRFPLSTVMLALAISQIPPGAAPPQESMTGTVHGRIEILNPKVKLRSGSPDASGVAVWLTSLNEVAATERSSPRRRTLEQRNKRFIPHVMVIQVGTEIDFPNRDPFFHNVFSVFDGKPFDLGLYAHGESRPVRFDRPGISYIFCNIHPQMSAVIVTVNTPYFAVSASSGDYSIKDVPQGNYELRVWHERSDEQQLAAQKRVVSVKPALSELGVIRLDEAGYVARAHKDKNGQEYSSDRDIPSYARP